MKFFALLLWITSLFSCAQAAEMGLRGTLVVISCIINNDKPVDVSFGEAVGVNKVDGVNYRQKLPLGIVCSRPPGELLHLMFVGTQTDFDLNALATDVNDLGIRLLQGETPIMINEPLPLDNDHLPEFSAVPVKRPNAQLTGGDFHSQVALQIMLE
ncbi:fimbrial protein [Pantoea sp. NPDC088449]|uniref:fimbrial protein n=1 Tax=Pantoea sp. NPDC088449 TaxID=3364392 RepID=UPI000EBC8EC2|nr:pilus assembly protein [Pantoea sp.]